MKRRPPPQSPPDAAGGAPAARAPPFTVALDLEHTLVCPTAADRAPEGPHDHLRSWVVRVGEREVRVYERPGVREFLSALQALGAELHLFTSGVPGYAAPVLDRLEAAAGVTFAARHFRPAAPTASACICARDLRVLGRDLARAVLVDDSPLEPSGSSRRTACPCPPSGRGPRAPATPSSSGTCPCCASSRPARASGPSWTGSGAGVRPRRGRRPASGARTGGGRGPGRAHARSQDSGWKKK